MMESEERVDYNQIAYYPSISSNRYSLCVRVEGWCVCGGGLGGLGVGGGCVGGI